MPPVCRHRPTVATVEATVVRIGPTVIRARAELHSPAGSRIGDAVRPRVVSAQRDAADGPALNGEQQAIVAGRSTALEVTHESVILPDSRIFQAEPPALVGVGRC